MSPSVPLAGGRGYFVNLGRRLKRKVEVGLASNIQFPFSAFYFWVGGTHRERQRLQQLRVDSYV